MKKIKTSSQLLIELEDKMLEDINLLNDKLIEYEERNLNLETTLVDIMTEVDGAGKKKYANEELRQYELKSRVGSVYVRRIELKREIEILRYKIQLLGLKLKNWDISLR